VEQAVRGDLIDLSLPPEWDVIGFKRPVAIPFGIVAPGVDAARRDDIDPDAISSRSNPDRAFRD
jgi:hypothetical protein